jgi:hypothetical protein
MIRKIVVLLFLFVSLRAVAQTNPEAIKYAEIITSADLRDNLSIIASDALEGRETGKRGQKMAAALIAHHFAELGLQAPVQGSYFQPVPLYAPGEATVALKVGNTAVSKDEFFYFGSAATNGLVTATLVFAGRGSEEEIAKAGVSGKAVFYITENVGLNNPIVRTLRDKGATAVFVIVESKDEFARMAAFAKDFGGGRPSLNPPESTSGNYHGTFFLSAKAGELLAGSPLDKLKKAVAEKKIDKVKPVTAHYSVSRIVKAIRTENVLGYLEGTDKKDELIVITAHYDHIGVSSRTEGDRINNGADDDGSGTVAVMALAKAFAQAKKEGHGPRRSILFMTVTAEEIGLLGSQYYSDNPIFPLSNTVVNLNIDMIGRRDPQHKESAPYVYVIGSDKLSSELHALSESTNKTYTNLIFDYTYNDQNHPDRLYYRSDHWNFARKDIPIIFYFDGIHDDYHRPSDEVDKIEFDLLTLRTKNIFFTAWEIANRDNRPVVDKK